ncbi:Acylphosphatase [Acrodontium crateriforme]|uniref:acylphosphatase n=1 Tax=Acrodontium crateriforme TaxID=150365 RepID=A0AAQ3M3B3_9PEZI|nr:Acylphosphatase [Acrodontium crateriforme]
MSKRIAFTVQGRVQGVNYRAWTAQKANGLNVTAYARNADDGTVVGEAQGDESSLDKFAQCLKVGPLHAQVTSVEQTDIPTKNGESKFDRL